MTAESVPLTDEQCWSMLEAGEFGRLAYKLDSQVQIVPINYVADGRRIVFRTAEGRKLSGLLSDDDVAFEIDQIGANWASSVILRGRARQLSGDEAAATDELPLRPWLSGAKSHVVEIAPTELSGFKFRLHRRWRSVYPEATVGNRSARGV